VPTVRETLDAFARLVLGGERAPAEIEDGARAVLIAEACRRSAASGSLVPVESLT
jgi:predicted dehydrogenase